MKGKGNPAEACHLAQNLGKNCGYAVFPAKLVIRPDGKADKQPLISAWPLRASSDPKEIARLWHSDGDLIGIVTGPRSGISVLDIDVKHPDAVRWWRANHARIPATRTYRTYSGGLHLYFQHRPGIKNTEGKLCKGIDTRGEGGFIVYWFAYGCECLDHTPPQPMPDWLYDALTYQPPKPAPSCGGRPTDPDHAVDGVLRKLAGTTDGNRNGMVFWAACRLVEHGMAQAQIETLILPIAHAIGLTTAHEIRQARGTIASATKTVRSGRAI